MAHEVRIGEVTEIWLDPALERPDQEIAARAGEFATAGDVDLLVGDPGTCPDGWPEENFVAGPAIVYRGADALLGYFPGVLGKSCITAYKIFRKIPGDLSNRRSASGFAIPKRVKRDGTRSRTTRISSEDARGVGSAIIGSVERHAARFPMCRLTAFNLAHPNRFAAAVPFIQEVDAVFAAQFPERHTAQLSYLGRTHPAWIITGTSFTTVTVNNNFRTAIHKDAGDLKAGFGVMCALRAGHFSGCWTVFPAYRVAVDMRTRGVLLADVHQWHANTVLAGRPGEFERVACVFYYREKMEKCLDPQGERDHAAARVEGDPIWPKE